MDKEDNTEDGSEDLQAITHEENGIDYENDLLSEVGL